MIRKTIIQNFKSHKNTSIEFSNLTVFCGSNGVGKSSVIHALLLLRESYLKNSNFDYLDLKSNPVTIGSAKDALYEFSDNNSISFEIQTDIQSLKYSFWVRDAELVKTMINKATHIEHTFSKELLKDENLFRKDCQFISAARLGPQSSYVKDDVVVEIYNQISVLEGRAEHFVHYLVVNKDKDVLEPLCNNKMKVDGVVLSDLFHQTTAWEREISEDINIVVSDSGNLGYELKFQFNTESISGKTTEFRASNVGFGVTYVMPIIVAILSSKPDALLLIENPEAHLHPNGQAKLTELICLAAQAGIQIVLETHSDHIINGILVQCKAFEENSERGISRHNVSIYNFDRDEKEHSSTATRIKIDEGGRVIYTPKGFFDQFTIDRKYLMGF